MATAEAAIMSLLSSFFFSSSPLSIILIPFFSASLSRVSILSKCFCGSNFFTIYIGIDIKVFFCSILDNFFKRFNNIKMYNIFECNKLLSSSLIWKFFRIFRESFCTERIFNSSKSLLSKANPIRLSK